MTTTVQEALEYAIKRFGGKGLASEDDAARARWMARENDGHDAHVIGPISDYVAGAIQKSQP